MILVFVAAACYLSRNFVCFTSVVSSVLFHVYCMRAMTIGILIGIHHIWLSDGSSCSQRTRCMHSCPSCRVLDPLFPGAFCPRVDRLGLLARVPLSAAPSPQLDGALHALPELRNHFRPLCVFALPPASLMLFVVTDRNKLPAWGR